MWREWGCSVLISQIESTQEIQMAFGTEANFTAYIQQPTIYEGMSKSFRAESIRK
jgi:hypothetical protein